MKLTTWNVNGIRARETQLLDWVQREQPDVVCLQEVKASPEQVPPSLCALEGYWCYWHGHKGYSGVGLHVRKALWPAKPVFSHPAFDHEHRIVTVQLGDVVIASIYVPNGGKDYPAKLRFLEALEAYAKQAHESGVRLLLCGDLNIAREPRDVHPKLQNPAQLGQTPEERAWLERIISHGLVDLSRQFEPSNDALFTWWAPWRNMRERNMGWRLDYVLASESLAKRAKGCAASREFGSSDHGPVTAVFEELGLEKPPPEPAPEPVVEAKPEPEPGPKKGQLTLFAP
jgi:exodeoxyribonuclease-3